MDLNLNFSLAASYNSSQQKIRVISETWISDNMYCPCCGNQHIEHLPNNKPVADFQCRYCSEIFELKSKKGNIGRKIPDGAYTTMIDRISSIENPNLFIMQYSFNYVVTDLIFVPKFFLIPNLIEKRRPLKSTAKRSGWIGCNILYANIPDQGKIKVIDCQKVIDIDTITSKYNKVKLLKTNNINNRIWLVDVLNCVNNISKSEFRLSDVYEYEYDLKKLHINNNNIRAKIRQQLQILRDKEYIEFLGNGYYRKIEI